MVGSHKLCDPKAIIVMRPAYKVGILSFDEMRISSKFCYDRKADSPSLYA